MTVDAVAVNGGEVDEVPQYPLPKPTDDTRAETTRLDGQHVMFEMATGAFYHSPIQNQDIRVLDIGCGTGVWCDAFARKHPSAQILGVDVAPPLPGVTEHVFPSNCSFLKFNIEDDWGTLAAHGPFDYMHVRLLILGVSDWPRLFQQAYKYLTPGGFFETYEGNVQLESACGVDQKDAAAMRWYDCLRDYMGGVGIDPSAALNFSTQLRAAGFEILIDRVVQTHLDPARADLEKEEHRQHVAAFQRQNWVNLVDQISPKVFESSKLATREEGNHLAAAARLDLLQNGIKNGYFVTFLLRVAQKPEA